MQCNQCGTNFRDGSKFCPKCGAKTELLNAGPAQESGNINTVKPAAPASQAAAGNKNNIIIFAVASAAALVLLISVIVLIGSKLKDSSSKAAERYWDAYTSGNVEDMMECVPKDYLDELLSEYDINKSELKEAMAEYFEDWEDVDDDNRKYALEDIKKVEKKIKDVDTYKRSKLKDLKETIDDRYDFIHGGFNSDNIEEAAQVDVSLTFYDPEGYKLSKKKSTKNEVFKYKNKWYSVQAMRLLINAAEEC